MAYRFVKNDIAVRYHGIAIYHLCRNDLEDCGYREFWFTTDPFGSEEGEGAFDVREIAGYDPSRSVASNLLGMIAAGAIGETGVLESEGGSPDLRPTEK